MKSSLFEKLSNDFDRFFQNALSENDPFWYKASAHLYDQFTKYPQNFSNEMKRYLSDYLDLYVMHPVNEQRMALLLDLANILSFPDAMKIISDKVELNPEAMSVRISTGMLERWGVCSSSEKMTEEAATKSNKRLDKIKSCCRGKELPNQSPYDVGLVAKHFNFTFIVKEDSAKSAPGILWFGSNPPQAKVFMAWLWATKLEGYQKVIEVLKKCKVNHTTWDDILRAVITESIEKSSVVNQAMSKSSGVNETMSGAERDIIQRAIQYIQSPSEDDIEYEKVQVSNLVNIICECNPAVINQKELFKAELLEEFTAKGRVITDIAFEDNKNEALSFVDMIVLSKETSKVEKSALISYLAANAPNTLFQNENLNVFEAVNKYDLFNGYPEDYQYRLCFLMISAANQKSMLEKIKRWMDDSRPLAIAFRKEYVKWLIHNSTTLFEIENSRYAFLFNLNTLSMYQSKDTYAAVLLLLSRNPEMKNGFIQFLVDINNLSDFYNAICNYIVTDLVLGQNNNIVEIKHVFRSIYWEVLQRQYLKDSVNMTTRDEFVRDLMNDNMGDIDDEIKAAITAGISSEEISHILIRNFADDLNISAKNLIKFQGSLNPLLCQVVLQTPWEWSDLSRKIEALVLLGASGKDLISCVSSILEGGWRASSNDLSLMIPVVEKDWDALSPSEKATFNKMKSINGSSSKAVGECMKKLKMREVPAKKVEVSAPAVNASRLPTHHQRANMFAPLAMDFDYFFKNEITRNHPFWSKVASFMMNAIKATKSKPEAVAVIMCFISDYLDICVKYPSTTQSTVFMVDLFSTLPIADAIAIIDDKFNAETRKQAGFVMTLPAILVRVWELRINTENMPEHIQKKAKKSVDRLSVQCDPTLNFDLSKLIGSFLNQYVFHALLSQNFSNGILISSLGGLESNEPRSLAFVRWIWSEKPEGWRDAIKTLLGFKQTAFDRIKLLPANANKTDDEINKYVYFALGVQMNQFWPEIFKTVLGEYVSAPSAAQPALQSGDTPPAQMAVLHSTPTAQEKEAIENEMKYVTGELEIDDAYKSKMHKKLANYLYDYIADKTEFTCRDVFESKFSGAQFPIARLTSRLMFKNSDNDYTTVLDILVKDKLTKADEKASLLLFLAMYVPGALLYSSAKNIFMEASRLKMFDDFPAGFELAMCYSILASGDKTVGDELRGMLGSEHLVRNAFVVQFFEWFFKRAEVVPGEHDNRMVYTIWGLLLSGHRLLMTPMLEELFNRPVLRDRFISYVVEAELGFDNFYDHMWSCIKNIENIKPEERLMTIKHWRHLYWSLLQKEIVLNVRQPHRDLFIKKMLMQDDFKDDLQAALCAGVPVDDLAHWLSRGFAENKTIDPDKFLQINDLLVPELLKSVMWEPFGAGDLVRKIKLLNMLKASASDLIFSVCILNNKSVLLKSEELKLMLPKIQRVWDSIAWESKFHFLQIVPSNELSTGALKNKLSESSFISMVRADKGFKLGLALLLKHPFLMKAVLTVDAPGPSKDLTDKSDIKLWKSLLTHPQCPMDYFVKCYGLLSELLKKAIFDENNKAFVKKLCSTLLSDEFYNTLSDGDKVLLITLCKEQSLFSKLKVSKNVHQIVLAGIDLNIFDRDDLCDLTRINAHSKKVINDYLNPPQPVVEPASASDVQEDPVPIQPAVETVKTETVPVSFYAHNAFPSNKTSGQVNEALKSTLLFSSKAITCPVAERLNKTLTVWNPLIRN
ncbi:MAG: hypothetical protein ACHQAX_05900 [Gammaproteobacteria bacterium]